MSATGAAGKAGTTRTVLQGQQIPDTATISLYDHQFSELAGGVYELSVTPTLYLGDDTHTNRLAGADRRWVFAVRGPRYAFDNGELMSKFPPERSIGEFATTVPHVVLARPTLPWERSGGTAPDKRPVPWLALIVLDDRDMTGAQMATVDSGQLGLAQEPHERNVTARTLTLEGTRAEALLPATVAELRLACHVRILEGAGEQYDGVCSVVTGTHALSGSGKRSLHLVSVEGWYADGRLKGLGKSVTFVSLHAWEITLDSGTRGGFSDHAGAIRPGPFGRWRPELPTVAQSLTLAGAVPLEHRRRDGSRAPAWYHGPLCGSVKALPTPAFSLPVLSPDDLLVVDSEFGLLDASYAAAWELGRLTLLSRPKLAHQLNAWKRTSRRRTRACTCCDDMHDLPTGAEPGEQAEFPIEDFFASDLELLRAVPFGYLVPDPDLLPEESLRFFELDPLWIRCLKDGAYSLGRATQAEFNHDRSCCDSTACLHTCAPASGILLRSTLVSDWPDLMLEAFAGLPSPQDPTGALMPAAPALEALRVERIGPHVLLALFKGTAKTLELHLHPQALHFTLSGAGAVSLASVAATLQKEDPTQAVGSALLARKLMSGTPRVRFAAEAGK